MATMMPLLWLTILADKRVMSGSFGDPSKFLVQ
jgi:hypothetical protein